MAAPDFKFDETGNRIFETPEICLTFDDGVLPCRYDNIVVKQFGDSQFDHIEWTGDDGQRMGVRVAPEVIKRFKEMNYPSHFEPYCQMDDPNSYEWFVKLVLQDMTAIEGVPPEWSDGSA